MAEMMIRLVSNPKTGKRDIYIDYESDDDALPHEHEQDHRDILEQLLGQGILDEDELGQLHVGRARPGAAAPQQAIETPPERDAQDQQS